MTIEEIVRHALIEDIGDGDHTSLATVPDGATGKVKLLVKEDGILCGTDLARIIYRTLDKEVVFEKILEDGSAIRKGDIAFYASGKQAVLLQAERLVLNFMQRLSGISTYTGRVVIAISGTGTRVLDTRKTTPLLRDLEKYAVRTGGGFNHRMGLYDMIMIKDNHVDFAGGVRPAILQTADYLAKTSRQLKVEIEVRNFQELEQVLETGHVDRIMLDNFDPASLRKAVEMIGKRYETEASGGITLDNIREYAETGVDFISVGALTHQIKSLDLSLKAM